MSTDERHLSYMEIAVDKAIEGIDKNEGGPFGCIIVRDGVIVGTGNNKVTSTNDPTAHAEITAIRDACQKLASFNLEGCVIYTSCEPCPMCFGAIYWARPNHVYYGCTKLDAANVGFQDDFIYREILLQPTDRDIAFEQIGGALATKAFEHWSSKIVKTPY